MVSLRWGEAEVDAILIEFDAKRSLYSSFSNIVTGLIKGRLDQGGVGYHSVVGRCKERASLAVKLSRGKYTNISEVTDIVGIRVITHFEDDVDKIAELIVSEFDIDHDNSVDKRELLDPDRFGYLSLHYVASLKSNRSELFEYKNYGGLKFEIQIRSILQHTWAELEHDIGYKSALEVPKHIRRRFSRLAGLLELADQEFIQIRDSLSSYGDEVAKQIVRDPSVVMLDSVSYNNYILSNEFCRKLDEELINRCGFVVKEAGNVSAPMEPYSLIGVSTVKELDAALHDYYDEIMIYGDYIRSKAQSGTSASRGLGAWYLPQVIIALSTDIARIQQLIDAYKFSVGIGYFLEIAEYIRKQKP